MWDPKQYLDFGDLRTRPALDLLSRIPPLSVSVAYDLGCGPGNSTAVLRQRWPQAQCIGVDGDKAMLARAAQDAPGQGWQHADIAHWQPQQPCQVIFSNAALHWLDDHHTLFPRLLTMVAPGGVCAVQMPKNHHAPSHRVMHELAQQPPYAPYLDGIMRQDPVLPIEDYARILAPYAEALDLWETTYLMRLQGPDAVLKWIGGSALRPLLAALPDDLAGPFQASVAAGLRKAYPRQPDGITLFPFTRLFIIATRPA